LAQVVLGDEMETTESTYPEDGLLDTLDSNQNAMQPPPGRDPQVRDQRRAWKPSGPDACEPEALRSSNSLQMG
jgi:hypothetical protein